jgi:hypothetical protein
MWWWTVIAATAGEPIKLKFDWSPGLSLAVDATRTRVSEDGTGQHARTVHATYTATVSRDKTGLSVSCTTPTDAGRTVAPLEGLALAAWPAWSTKKNGAFLQLLDTSSAEVIGVDVRRAAEAGQHSASPLMNAEAFVGNLTSTVAADWDALIGHWRGKSFVPGVPIAEDGEIQLPQIARPIRTERDIVAEPVACGDRRCVRLFIRERLHSDEIPGVLASMNDGFRNDGRVADVSVDYEWELITEPETMIPHSASSKRVLVLAVADGVHTAMVGQIDELVRTFSRNDTAPPPPGRPR